MDAVGFVGNMDMEKKGMGCHLHEGAAQRYGDES